MIRLLRKEGHILANDLAFPYVTTTLSQCCEILSGKPARISDSGGLFPRESQLISRSTRRGRSVSLRALGPSAHPLLVIFSPQALCFFFFPFPSSEIVLLTSVGPSLFPAIKTGPGGRRCLENVVIIAHTHTHIHTQGPLSSSLVNDAPNLARSRNESKVSSHHHHHSSAGS